jgi:hypothetical protein
MQSHPDHEETIQKEISIYENDNYLEKNIQLQSQELTLMN